MPYLDGKYVSMAKYLEAFPPRAVQLDEEDEAAEAAAPKVIRRGGEPVARPTNRKPAKQKAQAAAAFAATGVKLPDGIQLPEDGIVPPVSQSNSGGVVINDERLDEETE